MDLQAPSDLKLPEPTPVPRYTRAQRRLFFLSVLKQTLACAFIALLAYGAFQFITHFILQSVQVVGASMTPTLHDSGRYVLNRWVYHVRDPQPRDIVVLRDPTDDCYAIKRIVAKQGDTVFIKEGRLFINGKLVSEPYLAPNTPTYPGPKYREQMWICGVNQFFVLGDNRNNSSDSRIYGAVPRENILGMIIP
jgi:signal peptidase I